MADSEYEATKEKADTGEVKKEIKKILDFELLAGDGKNYLTLDEIIGVEE